MTKKYSEMPPIRAALQKWHAGQLIHGEPFVGDPLEHFYEELIDSFNYLAVLEERGREVGSWRLLVEAMLDEVWTELKARRRKEEYETLINAVGTGCGCVCPTPGTNAEDISF